MPREYPHRTTPLNVIQRPDLLQKLRSLLGIRGQLSITPRLTGELTPVVVVADLGDPIGTKTSRRAVLGTHSSVIGAVSAGGISLGTPTVAPWIRLYLHWIDVTWVPAVGAADQRLQVFTHPVAPAFFAQLMDTGRGGDLNPSTRSGFNTVADTGGMSSGNVFLYVKAGVPRTFDFSGMILEPRIPVGTPGGSGSTITIGNEDGIPVAGTLFVTAFWEEEDIAE